MENHNGVVLLDDERKFDEMLLVSTECWRRMTDRQTDGHISTESVSRKFWDWTLVAIPISDLLLILLPIPGLRDWRIWPGSGDLGYGDCNP